MTRFVLAVMLAMAFAAAPVSAAWAAQPNQNAGGGPGNSGPGDKNSPVEGPPDGCDHDFPGNEDACD